MSNFHLFKSKPNSNYARGSFCSSINFFSIASSFSSESSFTTNVIITEGIKSRGEGTVLFLDMHAHHKLAINANVGVNAVSCVQWGLYR